MPGVFAQPRYFRCGRIDQLRKLDFLSCPVFQNARQWSSAEGCQQRDHRESDRPSAPCATEQTRSQTQPTNGVSDMQAINGTIPVHALFASDGISPNPESD